VTRPDPTQSRATAVTDTRPSRARRRPRPGGGGRGQAGAARTRAPGRRGRAASPSPSGGPGRRPAVPCGPRTLRVARHSWSWVVRLRAASGETAGVSALGALRSPPLVSSSASGSGRAVTCRTRPTSRLSREADLRRVSPLRLRFGVPARDVRTRHALSKLVRLDSLCLVSLLVSRVSSIKSETLHSWPGGATPRLSPVSA